MCAIKKRIALLMLFVICLNVIMMCSCTYFINYCFGPGSTTQCRLPNDYDTIDYAFECEKATIKLTVYDDTTLTGSIIRDNEKVNISVKYELFGTAYEYNTAKIYNTDANECIDYVVVECDGKKLRLTAKNEEKYDPLILDGIKTEKKHFFAF